MKKAEWKTQIEQNCKEVGTYQPSFDAVIDTLADIMEMRDNAMENFQESGGQTFIDIDTREGKSKKKNPAVVVVMDLNTQALSYWRDLGLTPAGLRKINEAAMKGKKRSALADALKDLGG